jgi:tetratricopeptide (TPR) repeat protein
MRLAWLGALAACSSAPRPAVDDAATTAGAIAVANLDHQIAQRGDEPGAEELLLERSRFLGDYGALDRAIEIAERGHPTGGELVRRARTRAAVHRFADALADLAAAERAGAGGDELAGLRASIRVATGGADAMVPQLEAAVTQHPGFASRGALANAYAAVGRFADADRLYAAALDDLDTTSPFPYAWIYFARGLLWDTRDQGRSEAMYARAIAYLPAFATANIHLAELEIARGDLETAAARLERVVAASHEPEAVALLGALHVRMGAPGRGAREIADARQRYEALLALHPLAFADHGAEFFLGPGADPERAWALAQQNLAGRETDRAVLLAIQAARATGRQREACELVARARSRFSWVAPGECPAPL